MAFNYPIAIPYIILASVFVAIAIFLAVFTWVLKHRDESAKIPYVVTVFGLLAICLCLMIIPVDIFNVSKQSDPMKHAAIIKWIYYGSYLTLLVFAFVLIPFAYFFYEEADEEQTLVWRLVHTLKFTVFTVAAGVLVIILALVLRFGASSTKDKWSWIKNIVDYNNFGDRAIGFIVACLAMLGLFAFNIYTAYGLAAFPIGLMKRDKKVYQELDNVGEEIHEIRAKLNVSSRAQEMSGKPLNKKQEREQKKLKSKLSELERRSRYFDEKRGSWMHKMEPFMYPVKFVIGVLLLLCTVAIVASLIITQIDRAVFSECGIRCGFILNKHHPWNPLDLLLTYASIAFPVDYVLTGLFIALFMLGSLVGLSNIGIRFLFIKLYKIKFRKTLPQGLLTGCIFLMFIITVFSFSLVSFAPQYATFGSQKYRDAQTNKLVDCNMNALYNGTVTHNSTLTEYDPMVFNSGTVYVGRPCYMSQIATLVNSVAVRVPVFSAIFYFANWVFVAMYLFFFVVAIFRRPAVLISTEDSDDEEEDLIEKEPLTRRRESRTRTVNATSKYSTNYDI